MRCKAVDRKFYFTKVPVCWDFFLCLMVLLMEACSEMDEATPGNTGNLFEAGLRKVRERKKMLEEIAQKILDNNLAAS